MNKIANTTTKQELKSTIEELTGQKVNMRVQKRGSMRGYVSFTAKGYKDFNYDLIQKIKPNFNGNDMLSIQFIEVYMGTNWVWDN